MTTEDDSSTDRRDRSGRTSDVSRRSLLRSAGSAAGAGLVGTIGLSGGTGTARAAAADDPEYPSPAWFAREERNYARTREAPEEQASDPAFQARWQTQSALNAEEYERRRVEEPGWDSTGNLCAQWGEQCTGDPYRYPADPPAWAGDDFYETATVERVAFHDSGLDRDEGGARLSGRVWAPADGAGDDLPGVVVTNGSVQASETMYWWFAQTLVEHGYVVLTYDPRGQGRSDNRTPGGTPGTNARPSVFVTNQVDAIDFFRSTPDDRYPHDEGRTDVPAPVVTHNPVWDRIDHDRLGIVGHSLGAAGVSVVQGLDPWPGALDEENPVDAAVAWDNLSAAGSAEMISGYEVVPRAPTMGQSADYGLTPRPKERPPDPEAKTQGFLDWRAADVPTYQVQIRGGTHYEWSLVPTFPATSWAPGTDGGWGNPMADHYSLAWLDRWLKRPGEPGYADADDRLLADEDWGDRLSFYYASARAYPDREGVDRNCTDIEAGCPTS